MHDFDYCFTGFTIDFYSIEEQKKIKETITDHIEIDEFEDEGYHPKHGAYLSFITNGKPDDDVIRSICKNHPNGQIIIAFSDEEENVFDEIKFKNGCFVS